MAEVYLKVLKNLADILRLFKIKSLILASLGFSAWVFLVFGLGDRGLFKHLLVSFLVIGAAGLTTIFLYYDLGAAL